MHKKYYTRRKRLLFLNNIYTSKAEIKHTNTKAVATVYIYNREKSILIKKIRKLQKVFRALAPVNGKWKKTKKNLLELAPKNFCAKINLQAAAVTKNRILDINWNYQLPVEFNYESNIYRNNTLILWSKH